ncbi:hypothetical protein C7271_11730 [filamentous cyanobacterium CCP5]|nr:hypothetical protein C7271_11730 [filamentous cyanobacterium CCP5]
MTICKTFLKAAMAATALVSICAAAPEARALTFIPELSGENTLSFGGRARFNTGTGKLDFRDVGGVYNTSTGIGRVTPGSSGVFISYDGFDVILQDITLDDSDGDGVWKFVGDLAAFFTVQPPLGSSLDPVSFTLNEFTLERNGVDWIAGVRGKFTSGPANGQGGEGVFDPNEDNLFTRNAGASYSFDIEPVPTPALLPGLIGMGVAALRRKQSGDTSEETT